MLEHDVETTEPVFEEVKRIVLEKAKMFERRKLFAGGRLLGSGYIGPGSSDTPTASATVSTIPTAITSPAPAASDSIEELTRQISKLMLFLEGQPRQKPRAPGPAPTSNLDRPWQRRCMWCDSLEHTRGNCSEFTEALNAKIVGFNKLGRVKLMLTGEELPLMTNKGGMKEALKFKTAATSSQTAAVTSADVGAITFDDRVFASLGPQDGSARVTLLDFENGIRTDQIIDVEANEKRKREALDRTRRVRSQIDESGTEGTQTAQESNPAPSNARPSPANFGYPPPMQVTNVPEEEMTTESTSKPRSVQTSQ